MIPEEYQWAEGLIGKPWVAGGRGPDCFDCWGLVDWVYRERLGIQLPTVPSVNPKESGRVARVMEQAAASGQWEPLKAPEPLCIVGMSTSRRIHHVGLWLPLGSGTVLHALDKRNVIAQGFPSLRGIGINRTIFYRYVSSCHYQQPV